MNKLTKSFIIINIIWLIVISMFFIPREFTILFGKTFLVKVSPVDPRDLFRGDYVTLNLESLSNIDINTIPHDFSIKDLNTEEKIYVYLNTSGEFIKPAYLTLKPATSKANKHSKVYISGSINYIDQNKLNIKYGIEHFYIPEDTGNNWGESISNDKLAMKLSIDDHGDAISQVMMANGKEINFRD